MLTNVDRVMSSRDTVNPTSLWLAQLVHRLYGSTPYYPDIRYAQSQTQRSTTSLCSFGYSCDINVLPETQFADACGEESTLILLCITFVFAIIFLNCLLLLYRLVYCRSSCRRRGPEWYREVHRRCAGASRTQTFYAKIARRGWRRPES